MFVTGETFNDDKSPSKAYLPQNMHDILVREETFHNDILPLKLALHQQFNEIHIQVQVVGEDQIVVLGCAAKLFQKQSLRVHDYK
jgi:hypothetical protein